MIKLKDIIKEIQKKKLKNPRLGRCYELSGKYASVRPNSILVHGKLTNPFGKGHKELDHAWVEIGNKVFDPVMDKEWPKDVYEPLFKVKIHKKYSYKELFQMTNLHGNWGPWDDK